MYRRISKLAVMQHGLVPAPGYCYYPQLWRATYVEVPLWLCRLWVWRDRLCRSWALHCFNLRFVEYGAPAPWPTWLRWGWN